MRPRARPTPASTSGAGRDGVGRLDRRGPRDPEASQGPARDGDPSAALRAHSRGQQPPVVARHQQADRDTAAAVEARDAARDARWDGRNSHGRRDLWKGAARGRCDVTARRASDPMVSHVPLCRHLTPGPGTCETEGSTSMAATPVTAAPPLLRTVLVQKEPHRVEQEQGRPRGQEAQGFPQRQDHWSDAAAHGRRRDQPHREALVLTP